MEITETLVFEKSAQESIQKNLDEMRERHIRLSIDDFGSGYSSLGIFESIPASVIKLDRSFFLNSTDLNRQIAIMRGIVDMAHALDTRIVCEGAEREQDLEIMRKIGANVAQGYYYSPPVSGDSFEKQLNRGKF